MKYSEFLAEALLTRLFAYPELAGMGSDDRQEIGKLLIRKAASVKFQSSKRQIVMTFDLPGDDDDLDLSGQVEVINDPAEVLAPKALAEALAPDPEPDLSFNRS